MFGVKERLEGLARSASNSLCSRRRGEVRSGFTQTPNRAQLPEQAFTATWLDANKRARARANRK